MERNDKFYSRAYLNNYIDAIIDSIKQDKDSIIDLLIYGNAEKAEIIMRLSVDEVPSYQIKIDKTAEKSPFGEEDE
jgi:hypothetical protein